MLSRVRAVRNLEPMRQRVAVIDKDRVVAGHARPTLDRRNDAIIGSERDGFLNAATEQCADDALMNEIIANLKLTARRPLRHAR